MASLIFRLTFYCIYTPLTAFQSSAGLSIDPYRDNRKFMTITLRLLSAPGHEAGRPSEGRNPSPAVTLGFLPTLKRRPKVALVPHPGSKLGMGIF